MHETLDAAIAAFDLAMADVVGDMGGDADGYAYDLVISVAYDCTPEIAKELCRTQLGFVPDVIKG